MIILVELDGVGHYVSDYPYSNGIIPLENWTSVRPPNGLYKAKYNGTRLESGEWINGQWVDDVINLIGQVVYNTSTKAPFTITQLGPIPDGYTSQVPKEFDSWDGSLWITDVVLKNKTLKTRKMTEINNDLELALSQLRIEYPESEIMSWTKQEDEARTWLIDNSRPTPLLDCIVETRGVSKLDLINKVVLKAEQYSYAVGMAVGRRQYLEDRVMAVAIGKESELNQYHF